MNSEILKKLVSRIDLDEMACEQVFKAALDGDLDNVFLAAFLTAMKMKGESVGEIYSGAKVMREHATAMDVDGTDMLDTCGTGGDGSGTFNISTGTAFVCAAAGVKVAKHGNRSVSSKCGSFDVLEALGCGINLNAEQVKQCILRTNIGFMYAPLFHSAMKNVSSVRKRLGFRTIFNILGPLSNPAGATRQIMGVYNKDLMPIMINALLKFRLKRALVVHGDDGMDEITLTGATSVYELNDGVVNQYKINPEMFGMNCSALSNLKGGDAGCNAKILIDIFSGAETGPKKDLLVLNAGAALYTSGMSKTIKAGVCKASEIISNGTALKKLEEYIMFSNMVMEDADEHS